MGIARPARFVRFGTFQLDLVAGELLVQTAGEVVTREELHQKLWPNGTIVEFDNSINAAIRRLRLALEDSAEEPQFIETLPRRGYRFLIPVRAAGLR